MNIYMLAITFCLVFLFMTIELIRRQKLQEQYAILWLMLGFIMALFSLFPNMLGPISRLMQIHYAPSLLFLVGLLFSLVFIMHLTIVISKLHRKLTRLVQEVALLREQVRREGSE
ncbi:DUF2304 domain-containing protein [Paenibacillus sedimenti]|uniref:DUF2304 domain-containing protein n=1 Tax=Paenibacillus sedimenti TaxID=2770274 RepID=A0A926KM04_9BACL|nr:DUF2304 domain-containing protein [Paenibacillus sedimenti]MBD0379251.1 DUF2304 domain-containing protein [Paenibacillus sedimenti]